MRLLTLGWLGAALLVTLQLSAQPAQAQEPSPAITEAQVLDLRVLLVAVGDRSADPGRALMEDLMDTVGVPYEVLDSSREELTASVLMDAGRGRFNGIILTQADTYAGPGVFGLSPNEFALLHEYERLNGVAESVLAGWAATNPWLGVDYGMTDSILGGSDLTGQWAGEAGGSRVFEYVNEKQTLSTSGWSMKTLPRNDGTGPEVRPLLVDAADPQYSLVSELRYPDGRRVLLSTVGNAWFFVHSQVLAYEFLNYATSGLFIGARHVYLSAQNDDLFLPDEVWNPQANENWPEEVYAYRMGYDDVANAVVKQTQFQQEHRLAAGLRFEFSFNAVGAGSWWNDSLVRGMDQFPDSFRFINHTFSALQMDRLCPDGDSGTLEQCPVTDYATAYAEIDDNRAFWKAHRFPAFRKNFPVLLADSHSGLSDRRGTPEDPSDDIDFPLGANPNFLQAAVDLGISVLASDASRPNQDRIQRIPNYPLAILPRYPTQVYYNATTPEENTSEYNYIYYQRYVDQGMNPCEIPGAICAPRSYPEILSAEADTTVRHMLSYQPFPHYFHQTNLRAYDAAGHTLQTDWLDAVMNNYEKLFKLPVKTLEFRHLAEVVWQVVGQREALPYGSLDRATGTVTLQTQGPAAQIFVTGIRDASGETQYGGQWISSVSASPTPKVFSVDPGFCEDDCVQPVAFVPPAECGFLRANEGLAPSDVLESCDGLSQLIMQPNGNLVLYREGEVRWASNSSVSMPGPTAVVMQADGSLVVYDTDAQPRWQLGAADSPGAYLAVQNDGTLVLYGSDAQVLWASDSAEALAFNSATECGVIEPNQGLKRQESVFSCDGRFRLAMQNDGTLVLRSAAGVLWSSPTSGSAASVAIMQGDGNFVLYDPNAKPVWHTQTFGSVGAKMRLQDDGNLVIYAADGALLWDSHSAQGTPFSSPTECGVLLPNQGLKKNRSLFSCDGRFRLAMQSNGALVLSNAAGVLWSSPTARSAASNAIMQGDGNLVLYDANGTPIWHTQTFGSAGATLRLQDDGNLVIYAADWRVLWSTDTWER